MVVLFQPLHHPGVGAWVRRLAQDIRIEEIAHGSLREAKRSALILVTSDRPPLHRTLLENSRELLPTGLTGILLEINHDNGGMPMTSDRLRPLAEGEIHHFA
jgi:hypothetical protein